MDQLLYGLSGVMCYLSGIITMGGTDQAHLANLVNILERLGANKFYLKKHKCNNL